ncbi:hypothetical protein [Paraburkholderia aspalathi]|uniref:hypothetical protein n=1 Tax=Paraburkholderia aspalathi TaxID=1324617 RepID=UPI003C9992E6
MELSLVTIGLVGIALGKTPWLPDNLQSVAVCILFGGLGGCTYCLRGVYLNACVHRRWDIAWLPWYFIRPVVSLILGGVSYLFIQSGLLLLGASHDAGSGQNQLGIWAMTFLAGLNVDKFLTKIEAVGQSVWGIELSRQSKQQEKIESERP